MLQTTGIPAVHIPTCQRTTLPVIIFRYTRTHERSVTKDWITTRKQAKTPGTQTTELS
jgi:hypothetical protein